MRKNEGKGKMKTNEQLAMEAVKMDTPELANRLQVLAYERSLLKGKLVDSRQNKERNHALKRHIEIFARELNNRQTRMKGF